MIPKIIHYCWFGNNSKPELIEKCIESWRKFCPDWEIIEWNETNWNVEKIPYVKEAYESKKWAFVSDYARLDIIYNNGGVYLDTDVELYKAPEDWLQYDAVFAFETSRNIATGLGFAAKKNNEAVREMMEEYVGLHFKGEEKLDLTPCPVRNTAGFLRYAEKFKRDGTSQVIKGIKVLSGQEYASFATHHGAGTWLDSECKVEYKDTKWKRFLRRPSHFVWVEKCFGKKVLKLYEFFCYDIQEMGVLYFVKRKLGKKKR